MNQSFTLVGAIPAQIYIDPADTNYKGIRIAAEAFAGDVFLVTGKKPEIVSEASLLTGPAIVVGTMNQNPVVGAAVEAGSMSLTEIEGKWECYATKLVDGKSNALQTTFANSARVVSFSNVPTLPIPYSVPFSSV